MNLHQLDLNLLIVFDAVMTERSVRRAAERIGLSPPATSNALGRLREALGDRLFVRSSVGMVPTVKAEAIAGDVRAALSMIEKTIARTDSFDPALATRSFTIGMTDFGAAVLMPPIVQRLRALGSGLRLHLPAVDAGSYGGMLDTGRIDIAVGLLPEGEARHGRERLFRDSWLLLADARNERVHDPMEAATYAALDHIVFSPHGERVTLVDRFLRRHGISRRPVITVSHIGLMPALIAGSSYIATISARLAAAYARDRRFKTAKLPFLVDHFDVDQVWNRRNDREPALVWLRQQIQAAAA